MDGSSSTVRSKSGEAAEVGFTIKSPQKNSTKFTVCILEVQQKESSRINYTTRVMEFWESLAKLGAVQVMFNTISCVELETEGTSSSFLHSSCSVPSIVKHFEVSTRNFWKFERV